VDSSRRLAYGAFGVAALVAVGAVVGNIVLDTRDSGSTPRTINGLPATTVAANSSSCVSLPSGIDSGPRAFSVTNTSIEPVSVTLTGPNGTAYAEVESLAPRTTRTMQADLGGGTYEFRCYFGAAPEITSATFTVRGAAAAGPAVTPVSTQDLTPPTLQYENWVGSQLPVLAADARALAAAGTIDDQRRAWLTAHHRYETLGAAYGAFGDWDAKISGDGFDAIEASLWSASPTIPAGEETKLVADVDGLSADFPNLAIDPLDIGLRAHEITENTIEFTLSGRDDHGAHASLDTASANLAGTQEVLNVLRPLLAPRYAEMASTDAELGRAQQLVADLAVKYPGRPLSDLDQGDREGLNSAFGGLVELLAPIAAITDVRRTR